MYKGKRQVKVFGLLLHLFAFLGQILLVLFHMLPGKIFDLPNLEEVLGHGNADLIGHLNLGPVNLVLNSRLVRMILCKEAYCLKGHDFFSSIRTSCLSLWSSCSGCSSFEVFEWLAYLRKIVMAVLFSSSSLTFCSLSQS